jgi:hypothetical protein
MLSSHYSLRIQLEEKITQLSNDLINKGLNGHCDAFSLALMDYLLAAGEDPKSMSLLRISRERRIGDEEDLVESNPLSHIVIEALGTCWDVLGIDAEERWEDEWIQPESNKGQDEFDYNEISREDLIALRQKMDQRNPDPQMMMAYRGWLEVNLGPVGPVEFSEVKTEEQPSNGSRKISI